MVRQHGGSVPTSMCTVFLTIAKLESQAIERACPQTLLIELVSVAEVWGAITAQPIASTAACLPVLTSVVLTDRQTDR